MTKNTSRSTMGGSEKSRFLDYFSVLSVILYQKTVFFWGFFKCSKFSVPVAIGTLDVILSEKNVKILNMWCEKFMNFENISLNFFHVFRKKLKKKWIFLTPFTYWKSEEKHKKKRTFFWKITKITFQLTMGGNWKKNSKQIYQFHHCKYNNNRPHNCKYLLFFNDFTIYNGIFTDCSIFCVFYHLNLWEVSIFFRNGPMDF